MSESTINRRRASTVCVRLLATLLCVVMAVQANSSSAQDKESPRTLGVVLFPGFELLDAYGPLEMWGNMKPNVNVVTVSATKGPVQSAQGPKTVADYSFDDCPKLDLVLVPGGFGVLQVVRDEDALKFLKSKSDEAELTMSVCNGASLLAAAGLLDGRKATTNKAYWQMATGHGTDVQWVKQARWVDDGDVVTSSGVSAGMDMTLHVIERLYGEDTAQRLADMTEYEWHRDPNWDPFAELHGLVDSK